MKTKPIQFIVFCVTLIFLPSVFSSFAFAQSCGDGVCDAGEDEQSCVQDCGQAAPAPPKLSSTVLLGLVLVLVLAVAGFVAVSSGMKPPRGSG